MFRYQNTGQTHNISITHKSLKMWQKFKYLATTVNTRNVIHDKITRKNKFGEFLHPFSSELISQYALWNLQYNMYYISCCFTRVRNLVDRMVWYGTI